MNALKPHSEAWDHSLLQGDGLEGVWGLPPGPGGHRNLEGLETGECLNLSQVAQ